MRLILSLLVGDVEKHTKAPWNAVVQYLGTKGFFGSYDAKPLDPLTDVLAEAWVARLKMKAEAKDFSATEQARAVWKAEQAEGRPITGGAFTDILASVASDAASQLEILNISPDAQITRGDACRLIVTLTARSR